MITILNADIFSLNVDAIINPVDCVGVMGAGLAKEFKNRYPLYFENYQKKCFLKNIQIGNVDFFEINTNQFQEKENPRYIISFPTKEHWKNASTLEMIEMGTNDLIKKIVSYNIKSCAIPQLGCGCGKLNWENDVYPIVKKYIDLMPNINWYIVRL